MLSSQPTNSGHFGPYGGKFVPEVLMSPLEELENTFLEARKDPKFQAELDDLLHNYAGRPTPLYYAKRLSDQLGGARIYLKREDLLHTGAHKINNCPGSGPARQTHGQEPHHRGNRCRPARRRYCHRLPRSSASIAPCTWAKKICGASVSTFFRMRMLGAKVVGVTNGSRTLKDAISEAMRDWVTNISTTHYLLGSALGSHPYPLMVREFHRVIGVEAREQILGREGRLPDAIFACVGGGSNAIGIFHPFIQDEKVKLIGIEAGGRGTGLGQHAARFSRRLARSVAGRL